MKNHWLEEYRLKGTKWWTAEFVVNGLWALRCRRVELEDERALPPSGYGVLDVIFRNVSTKDRELLDFLNEAGKSMTYTQAKFRHNRGIFPMLVELEWYDLDRLAYRGVKGGPYPYVDAIKFSFGFNVLKHTVF